VQISQIVTQNGNKTTLHLDKNDCLSVVRHALTSPELKDDAVKIVSDFIEKKESPSEIDRFIANTLLLADDFSTETERKTIIRMIKRLKNKYDIKNT